MALLLLLGYAAATFRAIQKQSWTDETQKADAIVVFGAAEYAGRPSPVLRARLDHALALFQKGVAPVVITTGGAGGDPKYSEGGVGRTYLMERGVPEHSVIAETQSESTNSAAQRVARIMRANGMKSCVAVSDGYHIYRIKQMLAEQGVAAYGAPRPQSRPQTRRERVQLIAREVLSYTVWKLGITDLISELEK